LLPLVAGRVRCPCGETPDNAQTVSPPPIGGVSGGGHFTSCRLPDPHLLAPNSVYFRHTLTPHEGASNMPDEEWIKTLEDGRKVKFIYQELPKDGVCCVVLWGNEVVYSVVLTNVRNPLSREDVESHFRGELSKK
jgi:hypothetical protein